MSLHSEYRKEREEIDTYETDNWFFTYRVEDDCFTVFDGYIRKKYRKGKALLNMLNKIFSMAKNNDCNIIWMFTETNTVGWENSDMLIRKLGFEHITLVETTNHYIMELGV